MLRYLLSERHGLDLLAFAAIVVAINFAATDCASEAKSLYQTWVCACLAR